MTTEHSPVGPSGAARRIQCPASVRLEATVPTPESEASREGAAAHWVLAEILHNRPEPPLGALAPNGVTVHEEMLQGARLADQYVRRRLGPQGVRPALAGRIEERLNIPRVHSEAFGTPDFWAWLPNSTLFLMDYKFGHGYVEEFENPQLIDYIAGAADTRPSAMTESEIRVVAAIVQPRAFGRGGPVREWNTRLIDLRAHINVSSNAAHEALGASPRFRAGAECRNCSARSRCAANREAASWAAHESTLAPPRPLTPDELGVEFRYIAEALALLSARQALLTEDALALLASGVNVPGLEFSRSRSSRVWAVPADAVLAVGAACGLNLTKPQDVMTPRQAGLAGLSAPALDALSKIVPGAVTVSPASERGLRKIFS